MNVRMICAVVLLATSMGGCKNKGDDKTSAKAADDGKGGTSAAPAAAPTSCPAGATKNEELGFCLKLPAGYQELRRQDVAGTLDLTYGDPSGSGASPFTVSVYSEAVWFDQSVANLEGMAKLEGAKIAEQSDLPGGGKYLAFDDASAMRLTTSWAKGTKRWFRCESSRVSDTPNADYDAVCKSLVAL